jgi:hypothetical protein
MKPLRIVALISIAAMTLMVAACGCSDQGNIAANQTVQPGAGRPLTNGELTKQRQAKIQQHKDQ